MRQMTWEDWNPYRGIEPRQILVALVICLFLSLACEWIRSFRGRRTGEGFRIRRVFWSAFTIFYTYTIFCATILGRTEGREPEMRSRLMWTLEAALWTGEWIYWYYIVGNILLFVPLGFALMNLFMSRKRKLSQWKCFLGAVISCLLLSVMIEGIQYVTATGLCEADDLLHNTLGGGMGGAVYLLGDRLRRGISCFHAGC